jgi:pyruvate ferredoxin oxidoreductase gamma subunit
MKDIFEITIIGRGGQGSKTTSEVIASTALRFGKYMQAFSEYGAERSGAPMNSYVRISDKPITIHATIIDADLTVIMDDSLIEMAMCKRPDAMLVVNTAKTPAQIREILGMKTGRVFTVNSTAISIEVMGVNIPNTPTAGAISKAAGEHIVKKEQLEKELRDKLEKKIGREAMDKNIICLNRGYNEVKEG